MSLSKRERIEQILEEVQPRLAMHKGGVKLVDFDEEENVASLEMQGACVGCALSQMTLRVGIEGLIHEQLPEVTIVDVSDHSSGTNPYYEPDSLDSKPE